MGWKPSYIRGRRRQGLGLLLRWAADRSDLVELEIVPVVDGKSVSPRR